MLEDPSLSDPIILWCITDEECINLTREFMEGRENVNVEPECVNWLKEGF